MMSDDKLEAILNQIVESLDNLWKVLRETHLILQAHTHEVVGEDGEVSSITSSLIRNEDHEMTLEMQAFEIAEKLRK